MVGVFLCSDAHRTATRPPVTLAAADGFSAATVSKEKGGGSEDPPPHFQAFVKT
jgi:hypothetical protein